MDLSAEAVALLQSKNSFDANTKVIKVADANGQTLLDMTGWLARYYLISALDRVAKLSSTDGKMPRTRVPKRGDPQRGPDACAERR